MQRHVTVSNVTCTRDGCRCVNRSPNKKKNSKHLAASAATPSPAWVTTASRYMNASVNCNNDSEEIWRAKRTSPRRGRDPPPFCSTCSSSVKCYTKASVTQRHSSVTGMQVLHKIIVILAQALQMRNAGECCTWLQRAGPWASPCRIGADTCAGKFRVCVCEYMRARARVCACVCVRKFCARVKCDTYPRRTAPLAEFMAVLSCRV